MQDRPNVDELLGAVQGFLQDDVMPGTTGRLSFHARVAANALQWVRRELELEEEHVGREWAGLDAVLGESPAVPFGRRAALSALEDRNVALSARINAGAFDDEPARGQLLGHLRTVTRDKLTVTNPGLLQGPA